MSAIPTCISPSKYELLMPKLNKNGEEEQWELEEQNDRICNRLHQIFTDHPDAESLIRNINVGNIEDEPDFDFVAWVRETLPKIDFECGLTDICVSLLQIAIERGYVLMIKSVDLMHDLETWDLYAQYIRIISSGRDPLSVLITLPASTIIKETNRGDTSITVVDRIEDYGCGKNRFIGDANYRKETIIGLAGTETEQTFADALELAEKYAIDEWELHMASLEYLLDPEFNVSRNNVKTIMKSRKHLSKPRTKPDEFHNRLHTIKTIVVKFKNIEAKKMWTNAHYLSSILSKIPDGPLRSLTGNILLIPKVGVKACEICAEYLLNGDEQRLPANPYNVFLMMRSNVEEFLELIANKKSRDDEIAYLDRAVVLLENTPKVPDNLKEAVRTRTEKMHKATVTPEPAAPSNGSTGFSSFFSKPEDNSGMMKRRKN